MSISFKESIFNLKNTYNYNPGNGLIVTGSCQATCQCLLVSIGINFARGTSCCATPLCNSYPSSSVTSGATKLFQVKKNLFKFLLFIITIFL